MGDEGGEWCYLQGIGGGWGGTTRYGAVGGATERGRGRVGGIGVSLSEPHTSMTAFNMYMCTGLLVCLQPLL